MLALQYKTGFPVVSFGYRTLGGTGFDGDSLSGGIALDGGQNLVILSDTDSEGAGGVDMILAKYNSLGDSLDWQRVIGDAEDADPDGRDQVAVDAAGNIFIVFNIDNDVSGNTDTVLMKYNSSGAVQWQRQLSNVVEDDDVSGVGVVVDSSGNAYVLGQTYDSTTSNDLYLIKYNTSGALQWQKKLGGTLTDQAYGIAIGNDNHIYVTGSTLISGQPNVSVLTVKYNTAGDVIWQRELRRTGSDYGPGIAVAVDNSANVYVAGEVQDGVSPKILVMKYSSSGTVLWKRLLNGAQPEGPASIKVDSAGNVFVFGWSVSVGPNATSDSSGYIVKYDTDGVIQWQRGYGYDSEGTISFVLDPSNNMFILGSIEGADKLVLIKMPETMSLPATVGDFTIESVSLTDSDATGFNDQGDPGLTEATGVLTDGAAAQTSSVATLTDDGTNW